MPERQVHAEKPAPQERDTPVERADQEQVVAKGIARTGATGEKLKADMDAVLDDIEDVLETNAKDFVDSYIQKGGE